MSETYKIEQQKKANKLLAENITVNVCLQTKLDFF